MSRTSPKGLAFLEAHEGVVLNAYRDVVGVWTIGAGLTAASGVVKPKAGMRITRQEASALLGQALGRNYEPGVEAILPAQAQNVFDGAVSFHFNTGAIKRASWVKAFKRGDRPGTSAALLQWVKGGGKVLPGLKRRRAEEADVILFNRWPANLNVASEPAVPSAQHAVFVISVSDAEIKSIREGFRTLGYDPGTIATKVRLRAVLDFQFKHGLSPDGKIGKATLSTLQRELDAKKKAKAGAASVVTGGGVTAAGNAELTTSDAPIGDEALAWIGGAAMLVSALYLAWLAWRYRDIVGLGVARVSPRLGAWLRSF